MSKNPLFFLFVADPVLKKIKIFLVKDNLNWPASVGQLILFIKKIYPPLAILTLEFAPQEYFMMALFGVAIITTLSEKNLIKGVIAGLFGLLLSIVGMHPLTGEAKFTFDLPELLNGPSLVTALIGLYSLPEVVSMLKEKASAGSSSNVEISGIFSSMEELLHYKVLTLRASIIGIIIVIVPGAVNLLHLLLHMMMPEKAQKLRKSSARSSRI